MEENRKNYLWVSEQLRKKINKEEWLSSERMPSERKLSKEFDVARVTIRRALRVLESENLIRRILGSGTYVNPKRSHRIPLMIDYTGSMNRYAPDLKRRLIKKELISASESIAADLKIDLSAKVLYAERIDYNDNYTVAFDKVYIPEQFSLNLSDSNLETVNFLELWSRITHFQISICQQYIEAVEANELCKKYLNVKSGSPILKSTEFYYSDKNTIAGKFISFYHPERIWISSRYNWKERINNDRT